MNKSRIRILNTGWLHGFITVPCSFILIDNKIFLNKYTKYF